jgi:hypothetical protein
MDWWLRILMGIFLLAMIVIAVVDVLTIKDCLDRGGHPETPFLNTVCR